jgi:hypothetical protein
LSTAANIPRAKRRKIECASTGVRSRLPKL